MSDSRQVFARMTALRLMQWLGSLGGLGLTVYTLFFAEIANIAEMDRQIARGSVVGLSFIYLVALIAVILSYRRPRVLRSAFFTGVAGMGIFMVGCLLAGGGQGLLALHAAPVFLFTSALILASRQDWREPEHYVDWVYVPTQENDGPPDDWPRHI